MNVCFIILKLDAIEILLVSTADGGAVARDAGFTYSKQIYYIFVTRDIIMRIFTKRKHNDVFFQYI